jgi:hypothetical protein
MTFNVQYLWNRRYLQLGSYLVPEEELAQIRFDLATQRDPHTIELTTRRGTIFQLVEDDAIAFRAALSMSEFPAIDNNCFRVSLEAPM